MSGDKKKGGVKRPSPLEGEAGAAKRWAENKVELAEALGVSRQTIYNWEKLPGCPRPRANGRYQIEEWLKFGQEVSTADLGDGDRTAKYTWEVRLLKQKWERMQFKFELDLNEWTHNSVIGDEVRALVAEAVSILRDELETKAPIAHRPRNRAAIDRAMSRLHRGAEDLVEKFPAPAAPAEEE